jgi:radical SAM protein with 4Fe4S-binding SPASM domain
MLNVFLGYGCNLKCSYCLQAPMAERTKRVKPNPSVFIEKVLPWVIEKDIRNIAYWGGEPLVYWKTIETIHEEFRKAGHEFDMIKMATNGTLFTDKHVEQCNEWGVYSIISQHPEFGTPAWDKVMKLDRFSLSFLFYHGNLEAWPWIEQCYELEQRYQRQVFPYMHWGRSTQGADKSTDLTHKDLDKHIVHLWNLAELAVDGDRYCQGLWRAHLVEWREKLRIGEEAVPMCYGDHQIDIDLDGNRYGCHHTVEPWLKTGTLWDDGQNPAAMKQVRKFVDTKECQTCPIKTWCRGNCHLSRTHDVDCRLSKYKHKILSWLDTRLPETDERIFKHD